MKKAYLVTIRISDGPHVYDEYPVIYAGINEEAEELIWAYLRCGYHHGAEPGEWTVTDETHYVIEESHGDRLYSVHDIKEIPVGHAKVLTEYMAWDATEDAERAIEILKTYTPTEED